MGFGPDFPPPGGGGGGGAERRLDPNSRGRTKFRADPGLGPGFLHPQARMGLGLDTSLGPGRGLGEFGAGIRGRGGEDMRGRRGRGRSRDREPRTPPFWPSMSGGIQDNAGAI